MNELMVQASSIVPFRAGEVAVKGRKIAAMMTWVAEQEIRGETPGFDQDYNGAEREAMISKRAVKLMQALEDGVDYAGGYLQEELLEKGAYHPDLRGSTQEFLDELSSSATQNRRGQVRYFYDTVVPKAMEYGIDVDLWMPDTSKSKIHETVPSFRILMEEKKFTEEERRDVFLWLVELSTKTMTEIRSTLLPRGPRQFEVYQQVAGDGYEWYFPAITRDTKLWMGRQIQPYGRVYNGDGEPEDPKGNEKQEALRERIQQFKYRTSWSRGKHEDRNRFKSRSPM